MSLLTVLLAVATFGSIALLLALQVVEVGGASLPVRRRLGVVAAVLTVAFLALMVLRFISGA